MDTCISAEYFYHTRLSPETFKHGWARSPVTRRRGSILQRVPPAFATRSEGIHPETAGRLKRAQYNGRNILNDGRDPTLVYCVLAENSWGRARGKPFHRAFRPRAAARRQHFSKNRVSFRREKGGGESLRNAEMRIGGTTEDGRERYGIDSTSPRIHRREVPQTASPSAESFVVRVCVWFLLPLFEE
jgi:hypothetical protein